MAETPVRAKSFLYTAAPFGHEDRAGFQFVGLPEGGVDPELTAFLAGHIGYTPPLGVPSQPSPEEIKTHCPVTTRIIPNAPGGFGLVICTRYVGQVYLADGARGKWGNFMAHALAVPGDWGADSAALISIARNMTWRTDLTAEEIATGRALFMPDVNVAATAPADSLALAESDRAAAIAAALARLDGDGSLLLPGTDPDVALDQFAEIAAALPEPLRCRLRWSSFEFDAGAGYDIMATSGATQLQDDVNAYLRLDAPPHDALYSWAGAEAVRDPETFWTRFLLVHDAETSEPVSKGLGLLREVDEAAPGEPAPVRRMLGIMRDHAPDAKLVSAATKTFRDGFGALRGAEAGNIGLLIAAGQEASALSEWSGSDVVLQELIGWAGSSPEIHAAFSSDADPRPLSRAMARAVADGHDVACVLEWVLAAARDRIDSDAPNDGLVAAILDVVPEGNAALLLHLARQQAGSAGQLALTSALLLRAADREGLAWLDAVTTGLREALPGQADRLIASLRLRVCELRAAQPTDAPGVAGTVAEFDIAALDELDAARVLAVVETLERGLPEVAPRHRGGTAANILEIVQRLGDDVGVAPNALALAASASPPRATALREHPSHLAKVLRSTDSAIYTAFFDTALSGISSASLAAAASDVAALWRADIRTHFVAAASAHFMRDTSHQSTADHLDDALIAYGATRPGSQANDDWSLVCEAVALKVCVRVRDDQFDELRSRHGTSPMFEALERRRARRLRSVASSIGTALSGLFSRRNGGG